MPEKNGLLLTACDIIANIVKAVSDSQTQASDILNDKVAILDSEDLIR